jgi:predicted Zn finger-like uncharacterized protein
MRLICPNCDAEYEVDDAAIPENGRDVQCSNCGHAWFQLPPDVEAAMDAEDALFGAMETGDLSTDTPLIDDEDDDDLAGRPEPSPAAVASAEALRRSLDTRVLTVLREEAEREAAARRAEVAGTLETQTELGLPPPAAPTTATEAKPVADAAGETQTNRHVMRMKGYDPDGPPPPPPPRPGSRRELLPDIEEINSSLKSKGRGQGADGAGKKDRSAAERSGFQSGFVFSILIAVVAVALYVMAPKLAEQIPGIAPTLDGYVAAVDSARLWLDGAMRAATEALRGLAGKDG